MCSRTREEGEKQPGTQGPLKKKSIPNRRETSTNSNRYRKVHRTTQCDVPGDITEAQGAGDALETECDGSDRQPAREAPGRVETELRKHSAESRRRSEALAGAALGRRPVLACK